MKNKCVLLCNVLAKFSKCADSLFYVQLIMISMTIFFVHASRDDRREINLATALSANAGKTAGRIIGEIAGSAAAAGALTGVIDDIAKVATSADDLVVQAGKNTGRLLKEGIVGDAVVQKFAEEFVEDIKSALQLLSPDETTNLTSQASNKLQDMYDNLANIARGRCDVSFSKENSLFDEIILEIEKEYGSRANFSFIKSNVKKIAGKYDVLGADLRKQIAGAARIESLKRSEGTLIILNPLIESSGGAAQQLKAAVDELVLEIKQQLVASGMRLTSNADETIRQLIEDLQLNDVLLTNYRLDAIKKLVEGDSSKVAEVLSKIKLDKLKDAQEAMQNVQKNIDGSLTKATNLQRIGESAGMIVPTAKTGQQAISKMPTIAETKLALDLASAGAVAGVGNALTPQPSAHAKQVISLIQKEGLSIKPEDANKIGYLWVQNKTPYQIALYLHPTNNPTHALYNKHQRIIAAQDETIVGLPGTVITQIELRPISTAQNSVFMRLQKGSIIHPAELLRIQIRDNQGKLQVSPSVRSSKRLQQVSR